MSEYATLEEKLAKSVKECADKVRNEEVVAEMLGMYEKCRFKHSESCSAADCWVCVRDFLIAFLSGKILLPSDMRLERHGKWLDCPPDGKALLCSSCENKFDSRMYGYFDYCPLCGAKMDGKDGERNG